MANANAPHFTLTTQPDDNIDVDSMDVYELVFALWARNLNADGGFAEIPMLKDRLRRHLAEMATQRIMEERMMSLRPRTPRATKHIVEKRRMTPSPRM